MDTDNCILLSGNLQVIADGNYCRLNDSVDNTYFHKDAGAEALKIEVRNSTGIVAKVEFHPYDEKLWVYDTKNDGDTVYVRFTYVDPAGTLHPYGPHSAAGTSNTIDILTVDFDIPEDYVWLVQVFDDSASTDPITDVFLGAVSGRPILAGLDRVTGFLKSRLNDSGRQGPPTSSAGDPIRSHTLRPRERITQ